MEEDGSDRNVDENDDEVLYLAMKDESNENEKNTIISYLNKN